VRERQTERSNDDDDDDLNQNKLDTAEIHVPLPTWSGPYDTYLPTVRSCICPVGRSVVPVPVVVQGLPSFGVWFLVVVMVLMVVVLCVR
jgi:hypothetical protein